MKKMLCAVAVLAVGLAIADAPLAGKGGNKGGQMNVQVRSSVARATPNYLGAAVENLPYGRQVNVVGEQGNWYQIDAPKGFVPKSDLTKHKVAMNPDQKFAGTGGRHDEVALAGKGFNPQVERQYKSDNPNLARAFAVVDRVETFGANETQLKAFQALGKLTLR